MRRIVIATMTLLLSGMLTQPMGVLAQVAPAQPGRPLPDAALRVRQEDPRAYEFGRSLHAVTERAAALREALPEQVPGVAGRLAQLAVTGAYEVPVFAVGFADTPAAPWPIADLQDELFGAGGATLSAYYSEISGGRIDVDGTVYGWTSLPQNGSYYAGTSNGLDPANARIGELIRDTLLGRDASVDFGQFDNDGPDGIPNSGDDDGYVDFVAFVHPEAGGECGASNGNIWSHRWRYTSWPTSSGVPFITNDVSANGGKILVDDYVIQPGMACDETQMIQIGVFCHEFGHAFGLPDLYDVNGGGGSGLGHWCLMAAGNWNSPESPAHMSAWTKRELGWVQTVDVSWQGTTIDVEPVAQSGQVYRLGFRDDRWRRRSDCAISGSASLMVGLDQGESIARGWGAPMGYGNGWTETVVHDFRATGVGPVVLQFDYTTATEGGFDFAFVLVEVAGTEHVLAVYDGNRAGTASFDLAPYLGAADTYRVKFRFRSDVAWSNEDGRFVSPCAPFVVDDLSVTGRGEAYVADFEEHVGGWFQPDDARDNPVSEYWLVENRQPMGFDAGLPGTGLLVYHVDQEIIDTALGNSGGSGDLAARGVTIEEADGSGDLLAKTGGNRGDAGDPWPGASGATAFDEASMPAAACNDGTVTTVSILDIQTLGNVVRATFVAGDPAPSFEGVVPATAPVDTTSFEVALSAASQVRPGASVRLVRDGQPSIDAAEVRWTDHDRVQARFSVAASAVAGAYDVVVENPDGQTSVVADGFVFSGVQTDVPGSPVVATRFHLDQNHPNPFNPRTTLRFTTPRSAEVEITVYDARGRRVAVLQRGVLDAGHHEVRWDGTDDTGSEVSSGLYFARMSSDGFEQVRKMLLAR